MRYCPFLKQLSFIRYYINPRRLGKFENDLKLFDLSRGKYINYLMDDDLFHPKKIERMMHYYLNDPLGSIRLVTSHRQVMDTNGNCLNDIYTTRKLFENDTLLDSRELARLTMLQRSNFIGEPTTVLFRKKDLTEPFGTLLNRRYGCNVDLSTWYTLLQEGKAVYIATSLSYFRFHENQQSSSVEMMLKGAADFSHSVLHAPKIGFFEHSSDMLGVLLDTLHRLKEKHIDHLTDKLGARISK